MKSQTLFNTSRVSAICGMAFAETKLPKSMVSKPTCNNAFNVFDFFFEWELNVFQLLHSIARALY